MVTPQFEKAYKQLNTAQKKAVDTIEGPVMVIAGPGTGKTQILTLRIANILLKTQINPENILALTFTDSAVLAMRKRLVGLIGTPGYKVEINTFHGFCNEVIHRNPEDFPDLLASENITEVEQIQILEKILQEIPLVYLKPFAEPMYYLRAILSAINDLKKEGVTPKIFKEAVEKQKEDFEKIDDLYHEKGEHKGMMKGKYQDIQKDIFKNQELCIVYQKYQDELKVNSYYDFNDMLLEVIQALKNKKELLLRLQEVYQYILVDEHQDTNAAQNKLIELLASFYENPNLFVVGDEKQAIFRFQGASLENFLYFKNLYPEAQLFNLEENYRSSQIILNAAGSLIRKNITSEVLENQVDLKAKSGHKDEPIKIAQLNDFHAEYHFVAKEVKRKINEGVPAKEIAVLCRNNKDLLPLIEVFEQYSLPYNIESDQNVISDPQVRKLIMLFRGVSNFGSDIDLINLLHADFLGIEPLDVYKLIHYSNKSRQPLYEVISSSEELEKAGIFDKKKVSKLYQDLKEWKRLSENENLETVFVRLFTDSGLLRFILQKSNSMDILDKITGLYEDVKLQTSKKPSFTLKDFLSYLDLLESHDVMVKKPIATTLRNAVRLMTAHRCKGLEFDYVYIINAFDGHWGNARKRSRGLNIPWEYLGLKLKLDFELEQNEDERRLFYVALTRARKGVTITYSTRSLDGKEQVPSQFITEIDEQFRDNINTEDFEKEFLAKKDILFLPRQTVGLNIKEGQSLSLAKEFFREIFLEKGLSATALNNYLSCPWKYFYRNMVMLPDVKDKSLIFGTAVHKAINAYVRALRYKTPTEEFLLEAYKEALIKESDPEGKEYTQLLEKGEKVLKGFFEEEASKWPQTLQSELRIRGVKLSDDVILTGMLDLIEPLDGYGDVRVYDFKTGKPKSRNEIEGLTKNGNGDYKRQLVFYKILLDRYQQGRMRMSEGVIEFVEPDDKGRYHKELFSIDHQEAKDLEDLILQTADEIINLKFWNKRCDDISCQYCALRDVMVG